MTATNSIETRTPAKWTADSTLGPRQAKAFNEALSKFNWDAKSVREITDHGEHDVTPMYGGPKNPQAEPLMLSIQEVYGTVVSAANHKEIIEAIQAATVALRDTQPVEDRRTTPEERDERAKARKEQEDKAAARAAHLATLTKHSYTLPETARIIKEVLGVLYPKTTFSVKSKSYSGGCSIDAHWIDGPTDKQVNVVLDVFSRATFDGMEDLEHHTPALEWEGHLFDFTGNYVRGQRSTSAALLQKCADKFAAETKVPAPNIIDDGRYSYVEHLTEPCGWHYFAPGHGGDPEGGLATDSTGHETADRLISQMAHYFSMESPTTEYNLESWQDTEHPERDVRSVVFRIILGEVKAQTTAVLTTTDGVTISNNEEKQGVEIRFAAKPDASVLANLKAHGWRWSRHNSCWYHKVSPTALEFAQALATKDLSG